MTRTHKHRFCIVTCNMHMWFLYEPQLCGFCCGHEACLLSDGRGVEVKWCRYGKLKSTTWLSLHKMALCVIGSILPSQMKVLTTMKASLHRKLMVTISPSGQGWVGGACKTSSQKYGNEKWEWGEVGELRLETWRIFFGRLRSSSSVIWVSYSGRSNKGGLSFTSLTWMTTVVWFSFRLSDATSLSSYYTDRSH